MWFYLENNTLYKYVIGMYTCVSAYKVYVCAVHQNKTLSCVRKMFLMETFCL